MFVFLQLNYETHDNSMRERSSIEGTSFVNFV